MHSKNPTAVIAAAETELRKSVGYHITPAVKAAVEEGLQEGDRFDVGGGVIVTIRDGAFVGTRNGQHCGGAALSAVGEQQIDALLKAKALTANARALLKL